MSDRSETPEPCLVRGRWRYPSVAVCDPAVQRSALALATALDRWHQRLPEPRFEIVNQPGFQFRTFPPTLLRVPLAVVRGRIPTSETDWLPGRPLVVAEVMVGAMRYGDLCERMREYMAAEVPLAWVLTPSDSTITVHRGGVAAEALDARDTLTGGPELPGFSVPVADLFR